MLKFFYYKRYNKKYSITYIQGLNYMFCISKYIKGSLVVYGCKKIQQDFYQKTIK